MAAKKRRSRSSRRSRRAFRYGNADWDPGFHTEGFAGDQRYRYVPFHKLSQRDQSVARRAYPHSGGGKYDFRAEHYLYPVKKNGSLAHARRQLAIPRAMIDDDAKMKALGYEITSHWKARGL
jgi:hypothetical protein